MLQQINDPSQSIFASSELPPAGKGPFAAKDSYHFNLLALHNRKRS